jgi:hypothetical protein
MKPHHGSPTAFSQVRLLSDRDLAALYWTARHELRGMRAARARSNHAPCAEQLATRFQRIRELDSLCHRLWREDCRRTGAGSLEGLA